MTLLANLFLNSGFWMQRCGNTASASQSEHILAHIFESQYKQKYLHGECVATGVIIASFIQQKIFKRRRSSKKVFWLKSKMNYHKNSAPDYGADTQIFLVFGVFAAGFISRPLGSLFFGHIGDKYGRRFALFFSVILMSAPVGLVAVRKSKKTCRAGRACCCPFR